MKNKILFVFALALVLITSPTFGYLPRNPAVDDFENDLSDPICDGNPNGLVPHQNCSLYYACADGVPTIRDCPDGLYFDPSTDECEYPENVEECVGGTREPSYTPPPSTTQRPRCPPTGIHYFPNHGTCTQYTMCINGNPFNLDCSPQTLFDPDEKACVHESLYKCPYQKNLN